jgi:hypothetical protein
MSVLQSIVGQYGGLSGAAKQGQRQMGIIEMLGLGKGGYTSPIGPTQPGQTPMTGESIDSAAYNQQRMEGLAALGQRLSTFGGGLSQASAPSATPVSFGQALAGGNQALQAQDQRDLGNMKTQAEIAALGGQEMDLEKQAQQIMVKKRMGVPLSPQEEAVAQSYDAFAASKMQTITMPDGTTRQVPTRRPVFGDFNSGSQAPRQEQRPPLSTFMR